MDSFLLARGLRTLDVQIQRHGEKAMAVACMLEDHPMVAEVFYPVLDSHLDRDMSDSAFRSGRDYEEYREYMSQTYRGGVISFVVMGEDDDKALLRARNAYKNLRVINLTVSLGGGQISVRASGVHDSRHDTPRAEHEGRVEGRAHT